MMQFDFASARRIRFGTGVLSEAAPAAASFGTRALLVTGASGDRAGLMPQLVAAGLDPVMIAVEGEPTVELIEHGAGQARAEGCDVVVAIGGGSVIDAGKALAAMLTNPGEPLDYLEVVGLGKPLTRTAAPCIAIPTTAGTGSEVTRNAVLASRAHGVKASLRSAGMLPVLALLDPELTLSLPPALTASTGLDALTQLIEPYVSAKANVFTDMLCGDGIAKAAWALPRAFENGSDREARAAMSWASLLGGMALANAGLGAVHGLAAPLGGMFPAPHGAVCAALLPYAMSVNIEAVEVRGGPAQALDRYTRVARWLTGSSDAGATDGARWVANLARRLEVRPLSEWGVRESDLDELAEKAAHASSMKGNPVALSHAEVRHILELAL